jgi:hypothetical protein
LLLPPGSRREIDIKPISVHPEKLAPPEYRFAETGEQKEKLLGIAQRRINAHLSACLGKFQNLAITARRPVDRDKPPKARGFET